MTAVAPPVRSRTERLDLIWEERPGLLGWLTTVDHKRIGLLYFFTTLAFFAAGGIEALLMRTQLARANGTVLSPEAFNEVMTMHGVTMIFLFIIPMTTGAFGNYLLPLMIGARDMAFPRLNALSFWLFLGGGLFLYGGLLLGKGPNCGWFCYTPLNTRTYDPGLNADFYALGLIFNSVASTATAINLIVTSFKLRAPGMSFNRMPLFVFAMLAVSFSLVFALPALTTDLVFLELQRKLGFHFFDVAHGGDSLLWQHMFWLFGHPEVYILILPAMGIVSEVLPTFSRKPLFGYPFVVFSGIAIGFMSWGVWAHHMFTTGLGAAANSAFGISTIMIAVPTGVKIFNWLATLWGGALRLTTAMLFAIGFIAMFTIGGLTGVTHSAVPADYQQNDTYYIVAHFHQVLFGGALFGIFAGAYYWYPKFTGRLMSEGWGKVHFWLLFIGYNLTFQPMMILGILGMPRRIQSYPDDLGWNLWNALATAGAFIIAFSVLIFLINFI